MDTPLIVRPVNSESNRVDRKPIQRERISGRIQIQLPGTRDEIVYRFLAGAEPRYIAHKLGGGNTDGVVAVIRDAMRQQRTRNLDLEGQLLRKAVGQESEWKGRQAA